MGIRSPRGLMRCLLRVGLPLTGCLATAAFMTASFRAQPRAPFAKGGVALKKEDVKRQGEFISTIHRMLPVSVQPRGYCLT